MAWWWWLALGAAAVVGVVVWQARRRRARNTLVSIVMLRRSRRGLTEAEVRHAARRVISPDVEVEQMPSPDPGTTEAFAVVLNGVPGFFVIDAGRKYAQGEEGLEDSPVVEAVAGHAAWVSIDLCGGLPPKSVREMVFRLQGQLAAELLDDDCVALYSTLTDQLVLPDPTTEPILRSDNPMALFMDEPDTGPIVSVEAGDEEIEAAMEEARRQWPRFVEVWQRRGQACGGIVKARFAVRDVVAVGDGHEKAGEGVEYMWVEVASLGPGAVTGVLLNEPARDAGVRQGETVTVEEGRIADWACRDGERTLGMYVEAVLRGRGAGAPA